MTHYQSLSNNDDDHQMMCGGLVLSGKWMEIIISYRQIVEFHSIIYPPDDEDLPSEDTRQLCVYVCVQWLVCITLIFGGWIPLDLKVDAACHTRSSEPYGLYGDMVLNAPFGCCAWQPSHPLGEQCQYFVLCCKWQDRS